jgi:hypothetical protein
MSEVPAQIGVDFVRAVRRHVLPKARHLTVPVVYLGELTIAVVGYPFDEHRLTGEAECEGCPTILEGDQADPGGPKVSAQRFGVN